MQITIEKVLQEVGRLHLEIMRLNEEIAALQQPTTRPPVEEPKP